jgi:hypothetical protein
MNAMNTTTKVLVMTGHQRQADTARSGLSRRRCQ